MLTLPSRGGAESAELLEGVAQYRQENYEEAIELFIRARAVEPESSTAAFLLGLSYKQTLKYHKALPHLEDAVRLKPRIRDAVVELAYICLQLEKTEAAAEWIAVAEAEEIFPPRIAFLKGLLFQKQGQTEAAVSAFEKARRLDPSMTQSAEYNIALSYMKGRKLREAEARLRSAIQYDPQSDLATFARRYQDLLARRIRMEKPLRLTFAMFGQYDTNVVLRPSDSQSAGTITDEASPALATNLRVDYVPLLNSPWLFNAQYSYYGRLHKKHSTSHDIITNSVYAAPGYNFGEFSVSLASRYTHALLRDPSYKHYSDGLSVGPVIRTLFGNNHIFEAYAGYVYTEYIESPLTPEEDRDSNSFDTYLSWLWLFRENAFLNLRYEFTDEGADGANWDNQSHRISASATIPVIDKLNLQLNGDTRLQNFDNKHTTLGKTRRDKIYQLSSGLNWEFLNNTLLVLQYNYTRADSNLSVYDYDRHIYSLGIEMKF
ncbi:hypothetical protein DENIS_1052 [Desulfonema ishimotonii]|uniref:Surface lipoprotein assembly modifier C-terminal domain-containing protein n=2 Tax=Desulfonema ishimotonii TaxID=45657 RepID=A0A401FT10_9BACT|nr:hypothetical protein DENIS_1052 [Desulfonema ishimotonii]